jgi:PAS domain S-box-containing protein
MLKLWGKDASVIRKPLIEALPELAGQPFLGLLRNVYRTGVTYQATEDRADLVVDGKLQSYYFNFTYKVLRKANGEIYGILNMAIDVTEQVLSRRKILDGEEKLRLAVNVTEIGTFSCDLSNDKLEYSPRAAEIFTGSSSSTLSRSELLNMIHPDDRPMRDRAFEQAFKSGTLQYELRMVRADHSIHWIRVRGKVVFENNKPAHLYGTVLDTTQGKQVEAELERRVKQRTWELQQANKDLQYSNRELEQYAYVASHDLQEPLRKIITYGSLLRERSASSMDASARSRLDKIMASAARMSNLINDLLNFSRLLKEEHQFTLTDLNGVLNNVLNDFELTIEEKKAVIHRDNLPTIEASPQQMNQLFYNLLSNALKFSKNDELPVISFRSRLVAKEELPQLTDLEAGYLYYDITVTDNGIGFGKEHSDQIFEVFKRLHTREIYPGSGIGLALCRKIAMNHQGDIFAESEEGKGSTFHILLPAKQRHIFPDPE